MKTKLTLILLLALFSFVAWAPVLPPAALQFKGKIEKVVIDLE